MSEADFNLQSGSLAVSTSLASANAGADWILLDNMSDAEIAAAVKSVKGRALLEVSGGVTLERIPSLAALGVDFVSVGALTHSVQAIDIGLDIEP